MYSNPGTQVGTQNKDFSAVQQTELLTRSYVLSVTQASWLPDWVKWGYLKNLTKGFQLAVSRIEIAVSRIEIVVSKY